MLHLHGTKNPFPVALVDIVADMTKDSDASHDTLEGVHEYNVGLSADTAFSGLAGVDRLLGSFKLDQKGAVEIFGPR